MSAERWICQVCWTSNRPRDVTCWRCGAPSALAREDAEAQRAARAARGEAPETVPDLLVALPVVVFRTYARVWLRGGIGMLAVPLLMGFAGVVDVGWLVLSGGLAVGLVVFGIVAGEVSDGMREREAWAFVTGIVLAVVGVVGSILAFAAFAPGLISPGAVRWGSLLVFGGAGVAAVAGLVLLVRGDRRPADPAHDEPGRGGSGA
jgi:hypothetical protein